MKLRTLTSAGLLAAALASSAGAKTLAVGDPAPAFTIFTYDDKKVTSSDLAGKVVILNYWATWCGPCKREMVVLDRYVRTHPDVKVFAITTQDSLPRSYLRTLASALAFPLTSGFKSTSYGIREALPTSYVIDRTGVVRHAGVGAFNDESLDKLVAPLLADTPTPTAPESAVASR